MRALEAAQVFPDSGPTPSSCRKVRPAPDAPLRFRYIERTQPTWMLVDLKRMLDEAHPARTIGEFVGGLDLRRFEGKKLGNVGHHFSIFQPNYFSGNQQRYTVVHELIHLAGGSKAARGSLGDDQWIMDKLGLGSQRSEGLGRISDFFVDGCTGKKGRMADVVETEFANRRCLIRALSIGALALGLSSMVFGQGRKPIPHNLVEAGQIKQIEVIATVPQDERQAKEFVRRIVALFDKTDVLIIVAAPNAQVMYALMNSYSSSDQSFAEWRSRISATEPINNALFFVSGCGTGTLLWVSNGKYQDAPMNTKSSCSERDTEMFRSLGTLTFARLELGEIVETQSGSSLTYDLTLFSSSRGSAQIKEEDLRTNVRRFVSKRPNLSMLIYSSDSGYFFSVPAFPSGYPFQKAVSKCAKDCYENRHFISVLCKRDSGDVRCY